AFASGNDKDAFFWQSLIRQMILEGLLRKDIEEYGVIKFTKKGEAFLKKPKPFSIVLNKLYENADGEDDWEVAEESNEIAVDEVLFKQLLELRQQEAKKKSLPPFVIFLESSLRDMATTYPISLEGLEKCQGVSKGKALKYGKPFAELIANYVEENNIERPDDFVMKSVVNKSGNKVYIIQNTDKKVPLETIARNKGIICYRLIFPSSCSHHLGRIQSIFCL
ncbi:MAG: ATP-dependent DNA helicase RecQ, partial [Chitinophagaceae bacterium]|nr:ATP-dependent DNA helicase RecQ [Chitinophagaceae bacterium]